MMIWNFSPAISSWITDASGTVNQHLQYMPFGESFIDQRATNHDIRFKFTGKERDSETGFDYFGARYYSSGLSIWLSVDAMAMKYPSLSPFMYVAGNPVRLTDSDGREIDPSELYKKNDKGEYIHPNQAKAFEAFAKTNLGQKYLGKYAKKDQIIAGHTYTEDGVYHKKKMDLILAADKGIYTLDGRNGETGAEVNKSDGRLKITIRTTNFKVLDGLETFSHEFFAHALQYAKDFEDGQLDNSNIYKGLRDFANKNIEERRRTAYMQHWQERNVNKYMTNLALPILMGYCKENNIKRTKESLIKMLYDFQN